MMKKLSLVLLLAMLAIVLTFKSGLAYEYDLGGGRVVNILGSVSNQIQYSIVGDHYDTEQDLQQWLTTFQLTSDFKLSPNLSAYVSTNMTVDWIYDIKHSESSWEQKSFNESRDNLYIDDEWYQLLNEAHVTVTPGNFLFRIGKQIIKWGELESNAVLDTINPKDARRGMGDVEFETANIAIPMIRADYFPDIYSDALSYLNLQMFFIPNMQFIESRPPNGGYFGNDEGGIYSVDLMADLTALGAGMARIGRAYFDIDEPDEGDSDYFEYGIKLSGQIYGNIFSIMGFYGRENYPVLSYDYTKPGFYGMYLGLHENSLTQIDTDGYPIISPLVHGYYPREKFIGASFSSELKFLKFSPLGGTAPLFRVETRYDFDKTLANENWAYGYGEEYEEIDVFTYGVSLEWKVKFKKLQKSYWAFAIEYTEAKLQDYDSNMAFDYWLTDKGDTAKTFSFYCETSYFNGKIVPSLWFARDITNNLNSYWPGVYYTPNSKWSYYVGLGIFEGPGADGYGIDNKDYGVFKVTYNF